MKWLAPFLAILATTVPLSHAAEPSPGMELERSEISPKMDIIVEHYVRKQGDVPALIDDREVWLAPQGRPQDRVLLYTHQRIVEVLFSRDERWLIVNDYMLSDETRPNLFKRGDGVRYTEVTEAQISKKARRFVARYYPTVENFAHFYVEAVHWAASSKAVLISIYGHSDDTEDRLDPWLCVFHLDGMRFSLNFSVLNQGAFQRSRPPTKARQAK